MVSGAYPGTVSAHRLPVSSLCDLGGLCFQMHPGQAYLPNMSTRPTYAGPAAARDKVRPALWRTVPCFAAALLRLGRECHG
eukprot:3357440-Rhodomonas_salina.3